MRWNESIESIHRQNYTVVGRRCSRRITYLFIFKVTEIIKIKKYMKNLCINNQINILAIMCDVIKRITSSLYFVVDVDNQVHYIRDIIFCIMTCGQNSTLNYLKYLKHISYFILNIIC